MNYLLYTLIVIVVCLLFGCASQKVQWSDEEKLFLPLDTLPTNSHRTIRDVSSCQHELALKNSVIDSLRRSNTALRKAMTQIQDIIIGKDLQLEKGKKVILKGVNFTKDAATPTKESEVALQRAFIALLLNPDLRVKITGYTDGIENPQKRDELSLARANSVRDWLINKGIEPIRLFTEGRGSQDPIASNNTPEGREINRRIEFYILE